MSQLYRQKWMDDGQYECAEMFADLMCGWHHCRKIHRAGSGVKMSVSGGKLATFDFDLLTKLVIMAHDRCIRAEISHSGPRMVSIILHKREAREGAMHRRHPTIHEAVERYHVSHNPSYRKEK